MLLFQYKNAKCKRKDLEDKYDLKWNEDLLFSWFPTITSYGEVIWWEYFVEEFDEEGYFRQRLTEYLKKKGS